MERFNYLKCITTFLTTCKKNIDVANCLQEAASIFSSSINRSLSGVILDQNILDPNPEICQSKSDALLDHIIRSELPQLSLSGFQLRSQFQTDSFPNLPTAKSLGAFISVRIESHITGKTIAVLWAAKQRSPEKEWDNDQKNDSSEEEYNGYNTDNSELPLKHASTIAILMGTDKDQDQEDLHETFIEQEINCFVTLCDIVMNKVKLEASHLELKAQKQSTQQAKLSKETSERNLFDIQEKHDIVKQQLSMTQQNVVSLKKEIDRLNIHKCNADNWERQERVDQVLSTLNIDDDAVLTTTKLCTSLGSLLQVAPNACSVALYPIEKSKEKEDAMKMKTTFLPFLSTENVICDSLQCILSHKNVTLGHIATPRVSSLVILNDWIRRVNIFLYNWRIVAITKQKEIYMRSAENRVGLLLESMSEIKNERDQLLREREQTMSKVEKASTMLEEERAERLRLEGQNELLNKNQKQNQNQNQKDHSGDPNRNPPYPYGGDWAVPILEQSNKTRDELTGKGESSYGVVQEVDHMGNWTTLSLQRRCSQLTLKIQTQARQLSTQQELHVQQMTLHAASERNSMQRITELQVSLKKYREGYDIVKLKYEDQSQRFQRMLSTSKSLLGV